MNRPLILIAALVSVSACNSEPSPPDQASGARETPMSAPGADASNTVDRAVGQDPRLFVDTVAASDIYEIEAARLAEKNGKSQAVKDFAAMMIKDHTASTEKLKVAAGQVQPPVTLSTALPAELQTKLNTLKTAGGNFDAVYAQQQVEAHDKALDVLTAYRAAGTHEALKAFATQAAKVVEGHAKHARALPGG